MAKLSNWFIVSALHGREQIISVNTVRGSGDHSYSDTGQVNNLRGNGAQWMN